MVAQMAQQTLDLRYALALISVSTMNSSLMIIFAQEFQPEMLVNMLKKVLAYFSQNVVKALIEGANHLDVNARDDWRNSPLHLACEEGQVEVVKMLFEAGADGTAQNKEEKTPFQVAKPEVLRVIRHLIVP